MKKLCGRIYSIELEFFPKKTNSFFEPPCGRVRGNVCTSSVACWKVRGRLSIRDN